MTPRWCLLTDHAQIHVAVPEDYVMHDDIFEQQLDSDGVGCFWPLE